MEEYPIAWHEDTRMPNVGTAAANAHLERHRAARRLPATVLAVSRAVVHRSEDSIHEEVDATAEPRRADGYHHHDGDPDTDRTPRPRLHVGSGP